ncbi:MAG: hypothetical protein IJ930_03680 [Lachnospiraceae bacterium]|nr:hypothetical protein [Lachnospiraceae bacterium]
MTKKQAEMMVLIQDLVLAFVINSTATILNGGFTDTWVYLVGMFEAFSINYIAGLIIPVNTIGTKAADLIGLKAGSFAHKLIRIFVINAIFVTIISFTIALINAGPVPGIFGIWIKTYPILHIVGFITSVLIEKPAMELAKTLVDN